MPLLSSFTALAARALGLTNGASPGAPVISGISPTSTTISFNITAVLGSFSIARMETQLNNGQWVTTNSLTSHTFTGLTSSTQYTFSVRAVDVTGQIGPPSALQTQSTSNEVAPSQPASVTLAQRSTSSDGTNAFKLDLSFAAATKGTLAIASYQYRITRTSDSSVIVNWTTTPSGPGTTFIIDNLQPSTGYTAAVRAISTSGAQGLERTSSATTAAVKLNSAPSVNYFSENKNSTGSLASITFNYSASSGGSYPVSRYRWKIHTASETDATVQPGVNVTTTQYSAGETITITVYSIDTQGNASPSGSLTRTIDVPAPGKPVVNFGTDWNSRIDQTVLTWTRLTNTTKYDVFVNGAKVATINQPTTSTVTYTYTGITQQSWGYNFEVQAYNGSVPGPKSDTRIISSGSKNVPFTDQLVPGVGSWTFARNDVPSCGAGTTWVWNLPSYANDNFAGYRNVTKVKFSLKSIRGVIVCPTGTYRQVTVYWPNTNKQITECFGINGYEYPIDTNYNSGNFYVVAEGRGGGNDWFTMGTNCQFTNTNADSMTGYGMKYTGVRTVGHILIQ